MVIDPNEYMTGIPVIDKQHLRYVGLVDKLLTRYDEGKMDKISLANYINELISYTLEHFDAEEYLMSSQKYPSYEDHFAKHNLFRDKLDELLEETNVETINIDNYVGKLHEWLINWFKMELLEDDIKLAAFLLDKRIADHC